METRKNLCTMLPVALHTRVRQEQEKAGMTLGEYVEAMITEYYDWKDGKIMTGEMRTLGYLHVNLLRNTMFFAVACFRCSHS